MASDINHVVLVGRLTRDVELKYTPTGVAVAGMSLAVNRSRKNGDQWVEEANFFDVTLMGRQAEGVSPYLKKGTQIAVMGELRQSRWQQDGQNRSKVDIYASNIELLGSRNNGGSNGNFNQGGNFTSGGTADFSSATSSNFSSSYSAPTPNQPQNTGAIPGVIPDDFDDDIPF